MFTVKHKLARQANIISEVQLEPVLVRSLSVYVSNRATEGLMGANIQSDPWVCVSASA